MLTKSRGHFFSIELQFWISVNGRTPPTLPTSSTMEFLFVGGDVIGMDATRFKERLDLPNFQRVRAERYIRSH